VGVGTVATGVAKAPDVVLISGHDGTGTSPLTSPAPACRGTGLAGTQQTLCERFGDHRS
jgi:glutamate synthase domain-containing protein 2